MQHHIRYVVGFCCMTFLLQGMEQSSSHAKSPSIQSFYFPGMPVETPQQVSQTKLTAYIHEKVPGTAFTINQASTNAFSQQPDQFMVGLRSLQISGNKSGLESVKTALEKEIAKPWHERALNTFLGKDAGVSTKALQTQLEKVQKICDARTTVLLHTIKTGNQEQALKALKEIRRLSPYKYVPEFMMQPSQAYQMKLEAHMKSKSGFDELRVAEALYEKYHCNIRTKTTSPQDQLPFGVPETVEAKPPKVPQQTDLVFTTPSKPVNIHPEVDQRIELALHNLQDHADFSEHLEAVQAKLLEMHKQGLLEVPVDLTQQAIIHGLGNYFKKMIPNDPRENPKEFAINAIKYTALGAIHTWTGGALIPVQTAAMVAMKVQHLKSLDTSKMTPNDYAELITDELADISYTIAATKLMTMAKDAKIPEGFVRMTREMFRGSDPEVALPGGGSVSASEGPTMQAHSTQKVQGGNNSSATEIASKQPKWIRYDDKHKPFKNMQWKDVVQYTKSGHAKYKPGINIESVEINAWLNGIEVLGKPFKIFECDIIIGAKNGIETKYMVVKNSANTLHGHPLTPQEFFKYMKKK